MGFPTTSIFGSSNSGSGSPGGRKAHDHVKVPLEIRVGLKNRENFSKSGDETRKFSGWRRQPRHKVRLSGFFSRKKAHRGRTRLSVSKKEFSFFPEGPNQNPRKETAWEGFQEKNRKDSAI
jgi:hypothetical protein